MVSFVVLASGSGSNFQALAEAIQNKKVDGEIKALIYDRKGAYVAERAKKFNIPTHYVSIKEFKNRIEFDLHIKKIIDSYAPDYIYLLGYMKIIKAREFFEDYKNRILNLHPSLLPAFPGINAQKQAFDYGCKVSGITIHFVDPTLDGGPIIYQKAVEISDCKSSEEVADRLRMLEHEGVVKVAEMLSKGRFVVEGRRTNYVPF